MFINCLCFITLQFTVATKGYWLSKSSTSSSFEESSDTNSMDTKTERFSSKHTTPYLRGNEASSKLRSTKTRAPADREKSNYEA